MFLNGKILFVDRKGINKGFPPCDFDLSKCVMEKSGVFSPLLPFFPSLIFHEGGGGRERGGGFLYGSG
jgi:hypothetical protein